MSRNELFEVVGEMIDHMGIQTFTEEVMQGMSTDELKETVEHIDQHRTGLGRTIYSRKLC